MFCKNCGTQIDDDSKFCTSCGYRFGDEAPVNKEEGDSTPKKKKMDLLGNASLVLSIMSLLFPLGLIFDNGLWAVMGLLLLIPAWLVSGTALIAALIKRKKQTEKNNILKKRIIAVCLCVALPILVVSVYAIFQTPIQYSNAMEAYEEKDYARAYEIFSGLEDYKDAEEMARECNYQKAIGLAEKHEWSEARAIFDKLAALDYKGSKELAAYSCVWENADARIAVAESSLVSRLKDPSSYQVLHKNWKYTFVDRSAGSVELHMTIQIKYSATNSFGGRVTDTYSDDADVVLGNLYGYTASQMEEILGKSISQIVSKYN